MGHGATYEKPILFLVGDLSTPLLTGGGATLRSPAVPSQSLSVCTEQYSVPWITSHYETSLSASLICQHSA